MVAAFDNLEVDRIVIIKAVLVVLANAMVLIANPVGFGHQNRTQMVLFLASDIIVEIFQDAEPNFLIRLIGLARHPNGGLKIFSVCNRERHNVLLFVADIKKAV